MMNRIFKYIESAGIATALVVALLCSCSDNEISRTQTEVSISYPANVFFVKRNGDEHHERHSVGKG